MNCPHYLAKTCKKNCSGKPYYNYGSYVAKDTSGNEFECKALNGLASKLKTIKLEEKRW